jgi:hypothetical protein
MRNSDDDYPEIGKRRRGMVLVCQGDDQPDQFADWLQPLVVDFERLSSLASEFDIELSAQDTKAPIVSVIEFCERIGVEFSSKMWEGSLISGVYHLGWIKVGTVRSASAQGRKLIRAIEMRVDLAIREAVIRDIQRIKDLDEFIDRTADDRAGMREKIVNLSATLNATKFELAAQSEKISKEAECSTQEVDRACVRFASALMSGKACRLVAGPLVLWDDGVVYAICSWGGNPIPDGSSPAILLEAVQLSGRRLVRVQDATVIGGWLNPIYRRGPTSINGWLRVWSLREKIARTFIVDPPEYAEQVQKIHEALATDQ